MKNTNRYLVAACGVLLHLMLGSTYAWSVYRNPIMTETGWSQSAIAFAFSLAIFCLGLSAAFMGRLVERFGPRLIGTISAVLYAGGNALTGLAIDVESLPLLYLGYGILGGLGLGAGYITPVSTIIKWFPDKKGLATGLAIMGFGFASLLTSPVAQWLIDKVGLVTTFYVLALIYGLVMLVSAQGIKRPSQSDLDRLSPGSTSQNPVSGLLAKEALKRSEFYLLWLILFINIACGLGLISVVAPMAQDLAGLSAEKAAVVVGLMGIFNGFGRLLWAALSDYIGRPRVVALVFVTNILMTLALWRIPNAPVFVSTMAILMTCYGAGFSLIPPYLSDLFGTRELAALHGYILTAWAMAALLGPMILSVTLEMTGTYWLTFITFIGLYILGLVLSLILKKKISA